MMYSFVVDHAHVLHSAKTCGVFFIRAHYGSLLSIRWMLCDVLSLFMRTKYNTQSWHDNNFNNIYTNSIHK